MSKSLLKLTPEGFLTYPVFGYHRHFAKLKAKKMGKLSGSFMQGERNESGLIGELVFKSVFPRAIHADTYGYDFLLDGKRIEIKTQTLRVKPRMNFENALYRNSKQEIDYLVLCALTGNVLTFVGFLKSCHGLEIIKKGDPMPNPGGGVYKSDGVRIPYSKLSREWGELWLKKEV